MKKIFIILFFCAVFTSSVAENNFNIYEVKVSAFNKWLQESLKRNKFNTFILATLDESKYVEYYNFNSNIDRKYDIASMTKTFTAIAIVQLLERKAIKLDDKLKYHLPYLKLKLRRRSKPITLRHLLTHTSGLIDMNNENTILHQRYYTGYKRKYCNTGYVILKLVIEKVSKQKYSSFLIENILEPLGIENMDVSKSNGSGLIFSNIRDLLIYSKMLLNEGEYNENRIVSKKYFRKMFCRPLEYRFSRSKYYWGIGWEVLLDRKGVYYFHKAGRMKYEASGIIIYPKKNKVFLYLCNPKNPLAYSFIRWRRYLMKKIDRL